MILKTFRESIVDACLFYSNKPSHYNVFDNKDTNSLLAEFNLLNEKEKTQFLIPKNNRGVEYSADFQKLAFFVSKFQIMIKKRSQMKFSEDYVCSDIFYEDLREISKRGESIIYKVPNNHKTTQLFNFSLQLITPMFKCLPREDYIPQVFPCLECRCSDSCTCDLKSHSFYDKYHEVSPDLQFNFNSDVLLNKLMVRMSTFEVTDISSYDFTHPEFYNESIFSFVYSSYIFQLLKVFPWKKKLENGVPGISQDAIFHNQQLKFPFLQKLTGVLDSIWDSSITDANKCIKYSPYFLDIFNRTALKAILCNSDISIVLDSTCCLVFEHSQISQPEISFVEGRYLVNMKSTVTVVDLVNSDLTPNIILAAIFCDKLNRINEPNHMEHLLRCITVTDEQRLITLQNQKEFCKSIWDNKFNKFIKVGPDYIYQSRSFLKIPERYYQILIGDFGFTEMKFEDFYFNEVLVSNDKYEAPLSRAYKVYHKSNPGIPLILKVYDTRTTMIKKWRPQLEVEFSISTMLEMFAKEVEAYTRLGHNFSCKDNTLSACSGLMQNSNRSNINMPNLLASGFLDSKNANEPSGFFLLQSFIPKEVVRLSYTEKLDKASQALTMIHKAGLVHRNINRWNVLFSNGEVYFVNFGSSIYRRGPMDDNMELFIEENYFGKLYSSMQHFTFDELKNEDFLDLRDQISEFDVVYTSDSDDEYSD